jgi:hypothetical protein
MSRQYEIRTIQALTGERSLTLVLPKQYAISLGIGKGNMSGLSKKTEKSLSKRPNDHVY